MMDAPPNPCRHFKNNHSQGWGFARVFLFLLTVFVGACYEEQHIDLSDTDGFRPLIGICIATKVDTVVVDDPQGTPFLFPYSVSSAPDGEVSPSSMIQSGTVIVVEKVEWVRAFEGDLVFIYGRVRGDAEGGRVMSIDQLFSRDWLQRCLSGTGAYIGPEIRADDLPIQEHLAALHPCQE